MCAKMNYKGALQQSKTESTQLAISDRYFQKELNKASSI